MKMKKILFCCLASSAFCLAACGGGNQDKEGGDESGKIGEQLAGTYNFTVWVSESKGVKEKTEEQIQAFADQYSDLTINATVRGLSEADSATTMLSDVDAGADIYCFAQDQFARLVQGGALQKLGKAAADFVTANNVADSVEAVKSGDSYYAYPLTADNGYFLYYDKSVLTEDKVGKLEDIISTCEQAGKKFSFEAQTSAWYLASFFFGAGCHSNWKTDEEGKFVSVDDDFDSDKGLIAAKGIKKLVSSSAHLSSSAASDFSAATPSAALVSGTWAYKDVKTVLGDNMGVAKLPTYTVDGHDYQLGSYKGFKLMGVKPSSDVKKNAVASLLAQYLTSKAAQLERFSSFGWGPSNLEAQKDPAVVADPTIAALNEQNKYATPQGQIHGSWWDIAKVIASDIKDATDDAGLQAALKKYSGKIGELFTMSDETKRAFTVIGDINGDTWTIDIPMTENPTNTWTTEALKLVAGNEFKVRQGKSWDVAFGKDGQNYKVSEAEAGDARKIQLVFDETNKTGVVTIL